ncbi:hypothetical protein M8J76_003292 [Diaphorina citri]|nr:hypothetical protein M8J76_003292 [Diaphorina citri]
MQPVLPKTPAIPDADRRKTKKSANWNRARLFSQVFTQVSVTILRSNESTVICFVPHLGFSPFYVRRWHWYDPAIGEIDTSMIR